jgi:hypothetical protein
MPESVWKADPTVDSVAPAVLAAYDAAVRRGKPPVECYRADVEAWVRAHPDQVRTYAARQALGKHRRNSPAAGLHGVESACA